MTDEIIFAAALAKDNPDERSAYLDDVCAGDALRRERIDALLQAHGASGDFLERPAVEQLDPGAAVSPPQEETQQDDGEALDFLQPSDNAAALGRLVHYEVLEVLGRSAFATVLKAFDEKLHRPVAIKVLAGSLAASGTARQRFLREARAAAAVRDEHVVNIHAVEDQPVPYLVMEYVAGQNLQQKLDKEGPLPPTETLRIGAQIARGLAVAHQQGLVHRDVKPANILLENGVERVKLSDFGLARARDDASLTQSGVVAGTPMYMAPEQAEGDAVDYRADLFSLGSTLYAMCTGRPPFRASGVLAVLRRVAEDTPRPVREVNPQIPSYLSELIAQLHAKKPEDRPASAASVADLLEKHLAVSQSSAADDAGVARLAATSVGTTAAARPGRAHAVRYAAAAAVLLLAGLGLTEATGVTRLTPTVIRLLGPGGTLVIESDDPDVSVTITGDDLVIQGAGPREVRLKPGDYELKARRDGTLIDQRLVTIERNGRAIVRISRVSSADRAVTRFPKKGASSDMGGSGAVDALEVVKAYRTNTALADARFRDKQVAVRGKIIRIAGGEDRLLRAADGKWVRRYTLEMAADEPPGSGTYLSFQFSVLDQEPKALAELAQLKPGQVAVVQGSCSGWLAKQSRPDDRPCIIFWDCKVADPARKEADEKNDAGEKKKSLAPKKATVKILDILDAYRNNAATAAEKYTGKRLTIRGTMKAVSVGTALTGRKAKVYLLELAPAEVPGSAPWARCRFNAGEKEQAELAELRPGQIVIIAGTCKGWSEPERAILFEECKIVSAPDQAAEKSIEPKHTGDSMRRLAEWVLSVGGQVQIQPQDQPNTEHWVSSSGKLPGRWFAIRGVSLSGCKGVRDADLEGGITAIALTTLRLEGLPITDAGLAHVARIQSLKYLYLSRSSVGDAAITHLRKLPKLDYVDLSHTRITEKGLQRLSELGRISGLLLGNLPVTDAALEQLAELTYLTDLNLSGTKITDAGLRHLAKLDKLQLLNLDGTAVTGQGLKHLAGLKLLFRLELEGSRLTSDSLKHLAGLGSLQELKLASTPITDSAVEPLMQMTNLKTLALGKTKVTASGVARLRRALPKCEIAAD